MKNSARTTLFLACVVLFGSVSFHSFAATTNTDSHSQVAQAKNQVPAASTKSDSNAPVVAAISGSDPRPSSVVAAISGSDPRPSKSLAAISGSDPRPSSLAVA